MEKNREVWVRAWESLIGQYVEFEGARWCVKGMRETPSVMLGTTRDTRDFSMDVHWNPEPGGPLPKPWNDKLFDRVMDAFRAGLEDARRRYDAHIDECAQQSEKAIVKRAGQGHTTARTIVTAFESFSCEMVAKRLNDHFQAAGLKTEIKVATPSDRFEYARDNHQYQVEGHCLTLHFSWVDSDATVELPAMTFDAPEWLIWWTASWEAEAIGNYFGDALVDRPAVPEYLRASWARRRSCQWDSPPPAGKAVLFCDKSLRFQGDPCTELEKAAPSVLKDLCFQSPAAWTSKHPRVCGIVLRAADRKWLKSLPGFCTTLALERTD